MLCVIKLKTKMHCITPYKRYATRLRFSCDKEYTIIRILNDRNVFFTLINCFYINNHNKVLEIVVIFAITPS